MPDADHVRLRFPRAMRLRQSREFNRIRQSGQRVARGCLIVNWKSLPEGAGCRLGVITTKKLGSAVVRSRARRLLREVFRIHQRDFRMPVDIVLVARNSIAGKSLANVEHDFLFVAKQASLLKKCG